MGQKTTKEVFVSPEKSLEDFRTSLKKIVEEYANYVSRGDEYWEPKNTRTLEQKTPEEKEILLDKIVVTCAKQLLEANGDKNIFKIINDEFFNYQYPKSGNRLPWHLFSKESFFEKLAQKTAELGGEKIKKLETPSFFEKFKKRVLGIISHK